MKKFLNMTFCLLLILSVFTACGDGSTEPATSPSPSPSGVSSASPSPDVSPDVSPDASPDASSMKPETSGTAAQWELTDFRDTLKETYGGDYIPDREYTEDEIKEKTGLSSDLYEDVYAEGSTLDENPDIFIGVKAKSGKADEVEKVLEEYKNNLLADNKFEANQDKIRSAQVVKEGDHVFLFILGKNEFGDEMSDMAENFKNEMQKGVDAIRNMFS